MSDVISLIIHERNCAVFTNPKLPTLALSSK